MSNRYGHSYKIGELSLVLCTECLRPVLVRDVTAHDAWHDREDHR